MDINESDWPIFRRLHNVALDRFSRRALEEVRQAASCNDNYHDCYRQVYRLIRNHDKRMAAAFDDPCRSNAFVLLSNMIGEKLLTEEDLKQFSPEAQARIKLIKELRGT